MRAERQEARSAASPCATCGCPKADHPGFLAIGPCDEYRSSAAHTLQALDLDRHSLVTFTDHVYAGEVVPVYRTFEDAEEERGPSVPRRVCTDGDEWWLEAVDAE